MAYRNRLSRCNLNVIPSSRSMSAQVCCINRFTSLCKNLFNLLEFLAEAFRGHRDRQALKMMPRKASIKKSSKLNKFLHSEVNLLIQHIAVQDQDGQNNNVLTRLGGHHCRPNLLLNLWR